MNKNLRRRNAFVLGAVGLSTLYPIVANAVDTVSFNATAAGVTKSIATWGYDTSWPDPDNVRQDISSLGVNNVGVVRLTFATDQPLVSNSNGTYSLDATAQQTINSELALAALANPGTSITLMPAVGTAVLPTDPSYLSGSGINVNNWAQLIETTQQYINSRPGFTTTRISGVEVFNEPDYWPGEGTATQLNSVIQTLKTDPAFQSTTFVSASTLNSDNAQSWYSQIPLTTSGSSHVLGGSLTSYVNFIQSVNASGKTFTNPEMHSLGEAIVGANYGQTEGIFWADDLQARGQFEQASAGVQLGYGQDLNSQSAAAVYRAPNGSEQIFAGGLERFGSGASYRFVSTNRRAYFNGIGPINSYTLQANANQDVSSTNNDFANFGAWSVQGAYANVEFGSPATPALDGYRWEIQNTQTGQLLSVVNSNTSNGGLVNTAAAAGSANQLWNITQTPDGYLEIFNANSGLTLDVAGGSLNPGATVFQWGTANDEDQQWYINNAGGGAFYLRNAWSTQYLTGGSAGSTQNNLNTASPGMQTWRFVSANPTSPAIASFKFAGNANDSTGNFNAAVSGNVTYGSGPPGRGQSIILNGTNAYLTLPAGVAATTTAVTISAWVEWNGGSAWQRIFDFGTGTSSYMYLTPDSGDGTMRFAITAGGTEEDIDTTEMPVNQWVDVTLTLGGQTAILYLNGRPVIAGQVRANPSTIAATNDYIGKSQFSADPTFNGVIAGLQIFNYALTPSQVDDLINNNLTWVGGKNANVWDASTTSNFALNGSSSVFAQGDRVTFDSTGTGTVSISGTVAPFSINVTSNTNTTFNGSGSIGGSGTTLTKSGNGTLLIANTGPNTYTGDTTILGGTLAFASTGGLGTGAISLEAGGTLASAPNGNGTSLSNSVFADGGNITAGAGTLFQITGNIAGSGPLGLSAIFNASGLQLAGDDSQILGTVTVTGGNVRLGSATAGSAAAAWVVNGVLQTDVTGGTTFQIGSLGGAGGISEHANNPSLAVSTLSIGALNTSSTFAGSIVDNAANTAATGNADGAQNNRLALTKVGTATLTLTGQNTYTGPTTITAGTLQLGGGGTTGALSPSSAIFDNATLAFDRSNAAVQGIDFGPVTGNGNVIVTGGGTVTLTAASTYSGTTTVNAGNLIIGANTNTTGVAVRNSAGITISNARLVVGSAATHANHYLLAINGSGLTLSGANNAWTATLDLGSNDLDIQNPSPTALATLTNQIGSGYANGAWNGSGIDSSAAASDTSHLTALAVIQNNQGGSAIYTRSGSFDQITPGAGDILVKYTYYGDTNLDGEVDGSDYSQIDAGYASRGTLSGWLNGDFNYDGVIDGSDYSLIDNAFNNQTANLSTTALIASATAQANIQTASPASVPEPATVTLAILAAQFARRRRRLKTACPERSRRLSRRACPELRARA